MTIVGIVDSICEWLNENVCPGVEMKLPPRDRRETDDAYAYELVHPYAFPMYLPARDKLPPKVKAPFPSVTVQLEYGTDMPEDREISVILNFAGWNPGEHKEDWIIPADYDGDITETETFRMSLEGWRGIWNFIDKTAAAIEQTLYLGEGVEVKHHDGIEFGPYKEADDSIIDYYPEWAGYIRFKVRCSMRRNNQDLSKYL